MNLKKFDEDFIKFLINSGESNTLDFKQKVTSKEKIARTLAAMANSDGGIVLIGLSDQKKITGIDPEEEKYMVESANEIYCIPRISLSCHSLQMPDFEAEKKNMNEKFILLVEVKKSVGPKIYIVDKLGNRKYYIRVKDQTRLIPWVYPIAEKWIDYTEYYCEQDCPPKSINGKPINKMISQ